MCSYELASSLWVTKDIHSSNSIADMLLWTCIQPVSHHGHSQLKFNCWHAAVNSHPGSESPWTFTAQFNCWHADVNLHLASESPRTFTAQIQLMTFSCELSSRMWVTMNIQSSNLIADMLLWTCIQGVSHHGHSELTFDCWHMIVKLYLVCGLFSFYPHNCSHV